MNNALNNLNVFADMKRFMLLLCILYEFCSILRSQIFYDLSKDLSILSWIHLSRSKEGNVTFNDTLDTFYLWL